MSLESKKSPFSVNHQPITEVNDNFFDTTSSNINPHKITYDDIKIPHKVRWNLFYTFKSPPKSNHQPAFWFLPNATDFEKKLYFKLDCFLLTFISLSFFMKYLDYSAFQTAYVSGLQEAYGLTGSDYNWIDQAYYINYAFWGLCGTVLLAYFPPRIIFPIFEILWALFCILMCAAQNKAGVIALRCVQGGLAGFAMPAANFVLGTFYPPQLLLSRTSIFIFSGCVGPIIGGFVQLGLYSALANKDLGIPAFKMAQIVDGIIVIPVAIFGFFAIPPTTPGKGNFYLSGEEVDYLRQKTQQIANVEENSQKFSFEFIKSALTSWQLWAFNLAYTVSQMTEWAGNYQSIVLQAEGYSVKDCDNLPTIQSGVKAITSVIAGLLCNYLGRGQEVYLACLCFWIPGLAILVKYDVARAAQFIAYAFIGVCAPVSVIIFSWTNDMCRLRGPAFRAVVLGSLNLVSQFALTPLGVIVFDTGNAPKFTLGMRLALAFSILQIVVVGILVWCSRYELRIKHYMDEKINHPTVEGIEVSKHEKFPDSSKVA